MNKITEIKAGDKFKCFLTAGSQGNVSFQAGNIYESKADGTINDEKGGAVLWSTKPDDIWGDVNDVFIKVYPVENTKKEIRVYLIDLNAIEYETSPREWSDSEFMDAAEEQGEVYTLETFQNEWNDENVIFNSYIRFIEVEYNL